jgi:hypothetical protein
MWLVPQMALGVATSLLYFTWLLSFHTWRANMDELAYCLYRPMNYG